jgi:transcriptional regulator of acetoin/glycerol metabolism
LINVIEYAFVLCPEGEIMSNQLPARLSGTSSTVGAKRRITPRQVNAAEEKRRLMDALMATGGNKSEAARMLGISRVTLWKRLKAHEIQVDKQIRGGRS